MRHYSRKAPTEPVPLGTGDFEAVSYEEFPPPRRGAMSARPGRGVRVSASVRGADCPAHYASTPTPPNSLSPVAMANANSAVATGPQRAQPTYAIRNRPSTWMGMSLLLVGAVIGGFFGTMRSRHHASALASQGPSAPESTGSAASTPRTQNTTQNVGGPSVLPDGPPGLPPHTLANAPAPGTTVIIPPSGGVSIGGAKADKVDRKLTHGGVRGGGIHAQPARTEKAEKVASSKKESAKDKDDGWTVASAGGASGDGKETTARSSKETKSERSEAKAEKAQTDKAGREKKSSGKPSDDANAVLKAAMGATENTL